MSEGERDNLKKDFLSFIDTAVTYLNKWFSFDNENWLSLISCLSLPEDNFPTFNQMVEIIEKLNLQEKLSINMDILFEEMVAIKANFEMIRKTDDYPKMSPASDKWHFIFKKMSTDLENLFKLVAFFLSVPASSAFPERVFSVLNLKWREERNRCNINLIKHELYIYFNLEYLCGEFFDLIKNNSKLLLSAKRQEKYNFKRK